MTLLLINFYVKVKLFKDNLFILFSSLFLIEEIWNFLRFQLLNLNSKLPNTKDKKKIII